MTNRCATPAGDMLMTDRQALVDRLVDLHRAELSAIEDAEQFQRENAVKEELAAKELAAAKAKLAALVADDLADTKQAEEHARGLAAAYGRKLVRNAEMRKLAHAITGQGAPIPLPQNELETRLACQLSAVMIGIGPIARHRLSGPLSGTKAMPNRPTTGPLRKRQSTRNTLTQFWRSRTWLKQQ
jgi:hypothetical protein